MYYPSTGSGVGNVGNVGVGVGGVGAGIGAQANLGARPGVLGQIGSFPPPSGALGRGGPPGFGGRGTGAYGVWSVVCGVWRGQQMSALSWRAPDALSGCAHSSVTSTARNVWATTTNQLKTDIQTPTTFRPLARTA
jgi:hypothetical protein